MDRKKIREQFEQYVSDYDLTDPKILLKYIHTGKVAENCDRIAVSLNLTEEDRDIAWAIGMLHDIGRFEQLRRYDTFMDSVSIDHAMFGAELLFQEELIERFELEPEWYDLMEKAIRNHSLYRLPEGLTEREELFCQIIRDADKVDIYRANYETGMEAIYNVTTEELKKSPITPVVLDAFMEGHTVLRSLKQTPLDHLVGHLALTFELMYPESRKIAQEQGYLWKLAAFQSENPETEEKLIRIRERLKEELPMDRI